MFELSIIILLCTFPNWVSSQKNRSTRITPKEWYYGPKRPPWTQWVIDITVIHILNMTEEIVKDVLYKLKHAEKIRTSHGISISFELGSVAAGIQERFYRMLNMYRKYANMQAFKKERYTVTEILNGFHIMQGDYNEIRFEQDLYRAIVKRHESTKAPKLKFSPPTTKKSGRRQAMKWRPNND